MAIRIALIATNAPVVERALPAPTVTAEVMVSNDALLIGCVILAVIALAGIVTTVTNRRAAREAGRKARERGEAMRELLRSMRMAETMAGIGLWQYNYATGDQEWSDGLKRMFGVDGDAEMVEGDAETLLYANGTDLIGEIKQNQQRVEPFHLQFDIAGFDGVARVISVQACNLRDREGKVLRVVAVVRDVTEEEMQARPVESGGLPVSTNGQLPSAGLKEADPLTGFATRRRMMLELDSAVMEARTRELPLVLVMFDIDYFKRINDNYGQSEGDRVLQKVAAIARGLARPDDIFGRFGCEEFAWIIPGATEGMARVMAEKMRQAIARDSSVGSVPPVTISLGYATLNPGDGALSLLARADNALFEAKHSGCNRVRVAA